MVDEVNRIGGSARRTEELSPRDIGPSQFHRELVKHNAAYDASGAEQDRAREFGKQSRKDGKRLQKQFRRRNRDRSCTEGRPVTFEIGLDTFPELRLMLAAAMLAMAWRAKGKTAAVLHTRKANFL